MGKTLTAHFTKDQQAFLSLLRTFPPILTSFYLTGGTALAACYFDHRVSEDIDLFTRHPFRQEQVIAMMAAISKRMHAKTTYTTVDTSLRYDMQLPGNRKLKIDFVHYDFTQLEKPNDLDGLLVDSIEDISVNKLLTISQRTASKDFVDLYFILKTYTLWDLRIGVEHKFGLEMEPFYIASLLKKVDELDTLPIMKKKLSLKTLKTFFLAEAKKLALTMVKP